jgi:hypothetical protein
MTAWEMKGGVSRRTQETYDVFVGEEEERAHECKRVRRK